MKPASTSPPPLPPLRQGERLTQEEFHRRYEPYPKHIKAELIGGIVYITSRVTAPHGEMNATLCGILGVYGALTPGVEGLSYTSTILGNASEVQPDVQLRILSEYGGRTCVNEQEYIQRGPELVVEVAESQKAVDLGAKRLDYEQAGACEYLVVCLREQTIHWFDFRASGELQPTRKGLYRSRLFLGLWIDGPALLAGNGPRLFEVIQQGIASRGHAAFVKRLAREHRRLAGGE